MRAVSIGRFGKGRLWVDEQVEVAFVPVEISERRVTPGAGTNEPRSVTVEVYLPRGARAEYGLLGIRYESAIGRDLVVRVLASEPSGRKYEQSLAEQVDKVVVGLPAEYAEAVLSAICDAAAGRLGPGLLVVDRAAHGVFGSSVNLFKQLATLLVRLVGDPLATEEELSGAF
jgi:hypothetical protein